MRSFTKLLVANRGEIACRILTAARRMGLATVAVYSDADADAFHVSLADEAVRIGPAPASESYLSIEAILSAAKQTSAEAIHPGYGFLSENAAFAAACADAGLIFVGPPAEAIQRIGNKAEAKRLALEASVRCAGGYQGRDQGDETLLEEAKKIGFPVLIKAAAGGGGRGMRRVDSAKDFSAALAGARTEARNAFGSDELIVEALIENARHVEIQIIADSHGQTLALGERDCSVQRRHQKILEESPGPSMTKELRDAMSEAACRIAEAAGYVNAGTCEFLVDDQRNFYFLEMNTRLQVEHPVTEMVTGLDLVELQLRIAGGEPLSIGREDVRITGHAIEARLYAEDPSEGYRPQTGCVHRWSLPSLPGVRIDHGLGQGSVVTPYYDPMLAKIIAHGATREDARTRLIAALRQTTLFGVKTNQEFLVNVLEHEVFVSGNATTRWLEGTPELLATRPTPDLEHLAVACVVLIENCARRWRPTMKGWRSTGPATVPITLRAENEDYLLTVVHRGNRYTVSLAEESLELEVAENCGRRISWISKGTRSSAEYLVDGETIHVQQGGRTDTYIDRTYAPPADAKGAGGRLIKSPMSGSVLEVTVTAGMEVKKGDLLAIVEAMKMENHVTATRDGVVESVHVENGDQVDSNQLLITLTED